MRVIAATPPPTATPPPNGIGRLGNVLRVTAATPTPSGIGIPGNVFLPAAPTDISTNVYPKACAAHIPNPFIAGLLCQPIAAASKLFILWSWQPNGRCFHCPQDVDGFKVYLTDAG